MPGVLFVVCVPTAEYEKSLLYGTAPAVLPSSDMFPNSPASGQGGLQRGPAGENLIRLENVDLKDGRQGMGRVNPGYHHNEKPPPVTARVRPSQPQGLVPRSGSSNTDIVPMERILEELLKKLEVEHIIWCNDKNGYYYQVFFPVGAGDPCENCLHCLTEMGIGRKYNSVISVVPCTVFYKGIDDGFDEEEEDPIEKKNWNNFVQSIRAKLTVKSVVDGVRSGAECSFDYLLLVLTADMIAAVGLVESNSVNIVAAMLVSPLMSPIMAATFGTAIADTKLQKIGIRSEIIGLFISLIFGFIFGLLVGATEDPWGYGDWPTEEMKGRGMSRSLWIGILWALPSGTGVALALLQGSAGPLIGVAISASLLPPAVNCGIMWGMACIVLIYDDTTGVRIPHLRGENYTVPTKYKTVYSDWVPSELAIMGIISFCLTLVNICCIFITAVVVLKIKEVAAPYTSSPDLRRFWEHDIRVARSANRATGSHEHDNSSINQVMQELGSVPEEELEYTLGAALREAVDDDTFRKVKRCSYSANTADIGPMFGFGGSRRGSTANAGASTSPLHDPSTLDQVIKALLDFQTQQNSKSQQSTLSRFHQLSRSLRHGSTRSTSRSTRSSFRRPPHENPGGMQSADSISGLPTILETNNILRNSGNTRPQSLSDKALNVPAVRNLVQSFSNVQNRRSKDKFERLSLTMNPE